MTLIDRLRQEHDAELAAIAQRYENLHRIYDTVLEQHASSTALAWCRKRVSEGIPEWLVGSALASAHVNIICEVITDASAADLIKRRGGLLLTETPAREHLNDDDVWELDAESLEMMLDIGALTALARHGAEGRKGRGYAPGTFLRVAQATGLLTLDVRHTPLF